MSVPRANDIRLLTEKPLEPKKLLEKPEKKLLPDPLSIPQPRLPLPQKRMSFFERVYYQNRFNQFADLDEYAPFKDQRKF